MNRKYAEYLLTKTKENYNLIADYYSNARPQPWKEMEFLGRDLVKDGDRVLDLGCGSGRFYETMKEKNIEYIGVDNSKRFVEIARKRYPKLKFLLADTANLPFPDNYFDKVYAVALFHHIPSERYRIQVLKEAKRILKKSGLLVLTVWNLWQRRKTRNLILKYTALKILGKSELDFKDILMDWEGGRDVYFHCFTKGELVKLVKEAGFNITKYGEILVGLERKKRPKFPNSNFYAIAEEKITLPL